jgi:ABC-type spermidine/putrescine transport system permease subunit II
VLFLLVLAQDTGDPAYARGLSRAVETSLWLTVPLAAVSALTGVLLGVGTPWGVARHWWVVLKEIAFVPLVVTDLLVVAPSVHDAARGVGTGRLLDPAIAHCVVLALATVISIVKPFGRTPRGRRVRSRG